MRPCDQGTCTYYHEPSEEEAERGASDAEVDLADVKLVVLVLDGGGGVGGLRVSDRHGPVGSSVLNDDRALGLGLFVRLDLRLDDLGLLDLGLDLGLDVGLDLGRDLGFDLWLDLGLVVQVVDLVLGAQHLLDVGEESGKLLLGDDPETAFANE